MSFNVNCPHCNELLQVEEEWCGMNLECPSCGKSFELEKNVNTPIINNSPKLKLNNIGDKNQNKNNMQFCADCGNSYSRRAPACPKCGCPNMNNNAGGNAYGNQPYGNQQYGQQPYGNKSYGPQPYGNQRYKQQPYGNQYGMGMAPLKSKGVYIALGLFLGWLGVHNFYAGYTIKGIIQLMIFLLFVWFLGLGFFVTSVWSLIEVFTVRIDAQGRPFI